ncbi:hypothetical protein [Nonomuraea guangzhouensis]|uniref:Uncharacterized protein n=1 Tax=Nonomuraea guangzhouensis TaxID=1291555 RepID=A0ABW4GXG0_9ACTN|nr:hypothetical protein [Nonomuraea guangzhouensis]
MCTARSPTPPTPGRPNLATVPDRSAHTIIACDFLLVETILLKRLYVLVFIEHGTHSTWPE